MVHPIEPSPGGRQDLTKVLATQGPCLSLSKIFETAQPFGHGNSKKFQRIFSNPQKTSCRSRFHLQLVTEDLQTVFQHLQTLPHLCTACLHGQGTVTWKARSLLADWLIQHKMCPAITISMYLHLRNTNAADIYPHEIMVFHYFTTKSPVQKNHLQQRSQAPYFKIVWCHPTPTPFNPRYAAKWRMALGKSSRLDGVDAFIDGNQQGKLDGTWKPNNHFTSVPRATLLLFFPWISGFGSFQKINSCIILRTPFNCHESSCSQHNLVCLCIPEATKWGWVSWKGYPICTLVVYLQYIVYIQCTSTIDHSIFTFALAFPTSFQCLDMGRRWQGRWWRRNIALGCTALSCLNLPGQLTLVKIGDWIKGIWYLVYLEEEQSQAERSRYHDHSITPNSDTARKCKE